MAKRRKPSDEAAAARFAAPDPAVLAPGYAPALNSGFQATTSRVQEMHQAISGKTFQYTRPDGNGFITYNSDGTFSYQDDAKGGGTGTWSATGTQFCESFGKAPADCGEFKNTGDAYFAAKSRLVEMKV